MTNKDTFEQYRTDLMNLAYRMTGTLTDAEDLVQDTWLKWNGADVTNVENPKAYLNKILTHLFLDKARSAQSRRETYVGPWLPEPIQNLDIITDNLTPDKQLELADELSFALLLTLERLSPLERAAFILHDIFDYSFKEIGETLQRTPETCRKLASRARQNVKDSKPAKAVDKATFETFSNNFIQGIQSGDLTSLKQMLSDDVTLVSDGGGKKAAALNPIFGKENIAKFAIGIASKFGLPKATDMVMINGNYALKMVEQDGSVSVISIECNDLGQIEVIYVLRNPDKLHDIN